MEIEPGEEDDHLKYLPTFYVRHFLMKYLVVGESWKTNCFILFKSNFQDDVDLDGVQRHVAKSNDISTI